MENDILKERIDTGYTDSAGNSIFIGSSLSDSVFEKAFDCHPGIVKVDEEGRLFVSYKSTKNKNGGGVRYLTNSVAKKSIVVESQGKEWIF